MKPDSFREQLRQNFLYSVSCLMKGLRVCPEGAVRGNTSGLTWNKALDPTIGTSDGRAKQKLRFEGFIFVNKMVVTMMTIAQHHVCDP